jgi:AAA family ATP:ADP antiporter
MVEVRPGERRALVLSFLYFFALLCGYYVIRPVREEMGIAGGVRNLHWLFTATFLAMVVAVPIYGWVAARWPRRVFLPVVYRFFAACLLVFLVLFQWEEAKPHVARAFFVWVSLFNLFIVSVFWSFMADLYSSGQGKRLFGFIAAGGTIGALTGPAITAVFAVPLGPVPLLILSAALLEAATWCIRALLGEADKVRTEAPDAAAPRDERPIGGGVLAGVTLLLRSPYLLGIALYILLHTTASTILYFEQAHIVSRTFTDSGERTRVFALIDFSVNALTVLTQLFVTGRFVARAGVGWAAALLPLVGAVGFLALALSPTLAVLAIFQVVRRAGDYAVSRPAREVFYTTVTQEERYKAKNVIDTLIYRGGDAAIAWAFEGLTAAGMGIAAIAAAAVPLALGWAALALGLGRGHERRIGAQPAPAPA